MRSEILEYAVGESIYHGFLAMPDGPGPFPGVLISHEWNGRSPLVDERARDVAKLGYVGFAHDLYGKGKVGTSVEENQALMTPFVSNRALLRDRMNHALDLLKERPEVDANRVAATGYCFGGLCALDLVRSGAMLSGVVSFHGLLFPPEGLATAPAPGVRVLVLHGQDDPMVPPDQVLEFQEEMTTANVDWQLHAYGGTKHAFTNPEANNLELGTVFDERAAKRSWASAKLFLAECFEDR